MRASVVNMAVPDPVLQQLQQHLAVVAPAAHHQQRTLHALQVQRAPRDIRANPAATARPDCPAHQAARLQLRLQAVQAVPPVDMARRWPVDRNLRAHRMPVDSVCHARLAHPDHLATRASAETVARREQRDHLDCPVVRDSPARRGPRARSDWPARWAKLAHVECPASRASDTRRASLGPRARRDPRERLARRDHPASAAKTRPQECLAKSDHMDHLDCRARPESRDRQDRADLLELLLNTVSVPSAPTASKAHLDRKEVLQFQARLFQARLYRVLLVPPRVLPDRQGLHRAVQALRSTTASWHMQLLCAFVIAREKCRSTTKAIF